MIKVKTLVALCLFGLSQIGLATELAPHTIRARMGKPEAITPEAVTKAVFIYSATPLVNPEYSVSTETPHWMPFSPARCKSRTFAYGTHSFPISKKVDTTTILVRGTLSSGEAFVNQLSIPSDESVDSVQVEKIERGNNTNDSSSTQPAILRHQQRNVKRAAVGPLAENPIAIEISKQIAGNFLKDRSFGDLEVYRDRLGITGLYVTMGSDLSGRAEETSRPGDPVGNRHGMPLLLEMPVTNVDGVNTGFIFRLYGTPTPMR